MARSDLIAGLNIGTTKTAAVIATIGRDGDMDIVGFGVCPSVGLRKGVVTDLEETVKSIEGATETAERMGARISSRHSSASPANTSGRRTRTASSPSAATTARSCRAT